jgi:hypothetical protein
MTADEAGCAGERDDRDAHTKAPTCGDRVVGHHRGCRCVPQT